MQSPEKKIINADIIASKGSNKFVGFLKSTVLFLLLLGVIGSSFWVSYLLGRRILVPVSNLPEQNIEVVLNEPGPSVAALQELEEMEAYEEALAPKVILAEESVKKVAINDVARTKQSAAIANKYYYKVRAGTYSNKNQAMSLSKKLTSSGFHTYLKKVSEGWRVQVGAFSKKGEAVGLQNLLKGKGFSSTVVYE